MTEPTPAEWTVACADVTSRPRRTRIWVQGGHVLVQVPPGEVAGFTVEQLAALRTALLAAGELAIEQAGPRRPRT